ncbi:trefoil factor 2 isoform X1 [Tamandua tetradactyla]|uniref:trefoil factor 2 isoform X1 n=1 Tax=Tamandua tetradactyla TaxID=48850 RepID=UPI004054399F
MQPRGAPLLAVLLVLGLCTLGAGQKPSPCRCSRLNPQNRKNCGFPGITMNQCFNSGCCFDSSVVGVPWCFTPLPKQGNHWEVWPRLVGHEGRAADAPSPPPPPPVSTCGHQAPALGLPDGTHSNPQVSVSLEKKNNIKWQMKPFNRTLAVNTAQC